VPALLKAQSYGVDHRLDLRVVCHITRQRHRRATGRTDLCGGFLGQRQITIRHRQPRPLTRHHEAGGAADAPSGAGHEHSLAVENPGHPRLPVRLRPCRRSSSLDGLLSWLQYPTFDHQVLLARHGQPS
jgi:hypothetical protein